MRIPRKMNRMSVWLLIAAVGVAGLRVAFAAGGSPSEQTAGFQHQILPAAGSTSMGHEVQRAIDKGLEWLRQHQHTNGYWSTPDHPALTALALTAFQGDPRRRWVRPESEEVKRGYAYLLRCVQPDGSIRVATELPNYNTAISTMALSIAYRPEYRPVLEKARRYLASSQTDWGEVGKLDQAVDGGIGYGGRTNHSDVSNTLAALEAFRYSERALGSDPSGAMADLNWEAAIHFLQNCQNLPSHNKQSWVSGDPANVGGFVYYPGHSMAGETNLPSGRQALRSYGSISYAGLLSYIYADLKQDDPRVRAVVDWLGRNYTLEENPGMGPQGLYFYYHTMAKALAAFGAATLPVSGQEPTPWARMLALKLIDLQRTDGSWVNDNGRWWEKDPALVTAYSVIALGVIHSRL